MEKFYSVDEIAKKLNVHVKTIRRYIYSGKIGAKKIGGQWRVEQSQLDLFLNIETSDKTCNSCDDNINKDDFCIFMDTDYFLSGDKVQICSIVDYYVETIDEISKMSEILLKVVTEEGVTGEQAKFNYIYDEPLKRARFVLWGTPTFISKSTRLIIPFEGGRDE